MCLQDLRCVVWGDSKMYVCPSLATDVVYLFGLFCSPVSSNSILFWCIGIARVV